MALGELYAAEGDALSRDLARWGRALAVALLLLLAAMLIAFWLIAVVIGFVVALLAVWLPVWGAMLVTAGLLLLVVGVLGAVGSKRLQALAGPFARVQRRWRDHLTWWQEKVFDARAEEEPEDERDAS